MKAQLRASFAAALLRHGQCLPTNGGDQGRSRAGFFHRDGDGPATAKELARHCGAADRGARILADYLTIQGFLTKNGNQYALTRDSAMFLNRKSSAYAGGTIQFLLSPELRRGFDDIAATVRKGGTVQTELGATLRRAPNLAGIRARHGANDDDAGANAGRPDPTGGSAKGARYLGQPRNVGNGVRAKASACALVALDWAPVLELTRENAERAGLKDRFSTIAGTRSRWISGQATTWCCSRIFCITSISRIVCAS